MSKITFLSTAHPYRGGIAAFNETLAQYLIAQGEDVEIVTFTLQYPSFLFPGKSQYTTSEPPKGLKISREVNSINPFNWLKVGLKLRKKSPDVLFLRYWSPYLAPALSSIARIVRSNGHTKVITLADNIVPHESHFYDKILTSYFVGCSDEFIVMSREVENDLRSFTTTKKVAFHPHPIYENYGDKVERNIACREINLDENCRYALFFGFVRDYKGLDLLLDSWAKFKSSSEKSEDIKLVVAGEYYSDKNRYLEQIERLKIGDSVIVVDKFIDDNDVKYYFSAVDCVVQPYKSATQSGVTQIAYNFDTPMIVTNVGGLAEIVFDGESGFVVPTDTDAIAAALKKMFSEGVVDELKSNFSKFRDRFSWKTFTKSINLRK